MPPVLHNLLQQFWTRWIIANTIGWSLALYSADLVSSLFGWLGPFAPLLAGGVIGLVVALAQWVALPEELAQVAGIRRWLIFSGLGGILGIIAAFPIVALTALLGPVVAYSVTGAVFGLAFGGVQSLSLLIEELPALPFIWLAANGLGGCLCGLFALGIPPFGLPIFCTIGPPLFGAVTALAWRTILETAVE